MSRTLEEIEATLGDPDTDYGTALLAVREAYALGAASRSGESKVGWMIPHRQDGSFVGQTLWPYCPDEGYVRVRITVEPEEGT
jgi:hypothetical protein